MGGRPRWSCQLVWLAAQEHTGENIGETPTHTILIDLKGAFAGEIAADALGPVSSK